MRSQKGNSIRGGNLQVKQLRRKLRLFRMLPNVAPRRSPTACVGIVLPGAPSVHLTVDFPN